MSASTMVDDRLQSVENAIFSEDGIDPQTGQRWDELIDIDSWSRMYLLCEILGNLDSFKVSQYFYGNLRDGRIFAGPIWDSDKAIGNDNDDVWSVPNPDVFVVCRYLVDDFMGVEWIRSLLNKELFYEMVVSQFLEEFYPVTEMRVDVFIREYEQTIATSYELNRIRWQHEVDAGTIQEEFAQIRNYIHDHIQFLYSAWVEEVSYCQVGFRNIQNDQFRSVIAGQKLENIPDAEDTSTQTFCGWYYSDTDEPFDPERPITEDIEIYAKWEDNSTKKLDQLLKLVPLGVIGLFGMALLTAEIRRNLKTGKKR